MLATVLVVTRKPRLLQILAKITACKFLFRMTIVRGGANQSESQLGSSSPQDVKSLEEQGQSPHKDACWAVEG